MDSRKENLISIIVEEYAKTALPVGSKFLVQSHSFNVGSATIRNEMAELENLGYITHPHTSAGRIPTEKGYQFYIIVGGGKICRDYNSAAKAIIQLSVEELDWLGIYTTRLNANFIRLIFKDIAYESIITDPSVLLKTNNKVLIGAGWKPGWSTDYDAVEFAKKVTGELDKKINPDIIIISPETGEKDGKIKKKDIKIEKIRELQQALSLSAYFGKYKVAIIDEAEKLTNASQNALLKTLEEPPQKTVIILITENVDKIIPTVKSRCVIKKFGLAKKKEIVDSLVAETNKKKYNEIIERILAP